jgi:hypothetical protein
VRVAQRHRDRRVTQKLLHRLHRHPTHGQVAREAVPEPVPLDVAQPRSLARAHQGPAADLLRERCAVFQTEHALTAQMPMTLERVEHARVERHFAVSLEEGTKLEAVLWLEDDTTRIDSVMMAAELRRTPTWGRGHEMAAHKKLSVATDVQVYFCDPRSPWQRGSNENTNGLLRQYFPKGKDLSRYSQAELNRVARQLNQRPRETLGFRTPAVTLSATVAATG